MFNSIKLPIRKITTGLIREYLITYEERNDCGKLTLDNLRKNLSSFYSWLEYKDYIIKNPIRRILKVKIGSSIKKVISAENMVIMRDGCRNIRDLTMVDFLFTTGMHVGELVKLKISDMNLEERTCIVYCKGDFILW